MFISDNWPSLRQANLVTEANAVIGRPLTPGSVAGVARRTSGRAVRRNVHYRTAGYYAPPLRLLQALLALARVERRYEWFRALRAWVDLPRNISRGLGSSTVFCARREAHRDMEYLQAARRRKFPYRYSPDHDGHHHHQNIGLAGRR
jgi:hypothetical protein